MAEGKIYQAKEKCAAWSTPSAKGKKVKQYAKGAEICIYKEKNGYGNAVKKGNRWVKLTKLKLVSSVVATAKENTAKANEASITSGNKYRTSSSSWYGKSTSTYTGLIKKYVRAFGSPPRFTDKVDPYYGEKKDTFGTGRAMMSTWFSDPAILSICPGTVDYLPGFSRKNKDKFFNKIKASMNGDIAKLAKKDHGKDLNGQLYSFKSAYKSYMNVVNLLARAASDYLGIGDVSDLFQGGKTPLNKFDYGWYQTPSKSVGKSSIFAETQHALNSAVSDESYIHFFSNQSGVTSGDSFQTDSGESWLEEQLGSSSGISKQAQTLQFLFGGAISSEAEDDIQRILDDARGVNEFMGGFAQIATNYLKGGRLVFPKMITDMSYEKSISVELTFSSLYGDKRSIFKYCILPCLHLLALATPKQLSENMYTYPYLVRAYERGNFIADLAFISGLELTRGGSDQTSWTVDGLPTEIVARFTITPLYSNMMVTSSRNPFLYMGNTALIEYLGNLCGLDMKVNNLQVKTKLANQLLANYVMDTPSTFARGLTDSFIISEAGKFFRLTT